MADDYGGISRPFGDTPHTSGHPAASLDVTDVSGRLSRSSVAIDTGDLRRAYDFGSSFTKISKSRDPLLHIMNKWRKKPTTDWKWKYTLKREFAGWERYGYVVGISAAGELVSADLAVTAGSETAWVETAAGPYADLLDASVSPGGDDMFANSSLPTTQGQTCCLAMMGDYKLSGNLHNRIGSTTSDSDYIMIGDVGTKPNYILQNQTLKIPVSSSTPHAGAGTVNAVTEYAMVKVLSVYDFTIYGYGTGVAIAEGILVNVRMIKTSSTHKYPTSLLAATTWAKATAIVFSAAHTTGTGSLAQKLEPARTKVAGTAYHELSGYGPTYRDQPYSTDYGLNQIFKETALMSGRAMATELKFEKNPWTEEWQKKTLMLNWDMAQSAYFGEQYEDADGITYTEGLVNFILNNGHKFSLTYASKTLDDFLEDFSAYNDKRLQPNMGGSTGFFCPTRTWNWLAKLSGLMQNTVQLSPNYQISWAGFGSIDGIQTRRIMVDGTVVNFILDPHLDSTHVKLIAANFNGCAIRPMIGNGISRDFKIIPGVKTVEKGGEDFRVDLIMADVGFEFSVPELMACWT